MNPWRGRSALDAVELMDVGWNFRREHLRLSQRSHYVITAGGAQPNVVPSTATVWYYLRETDYDHIKELRAIADRIAHGAAEMTDTTVSSHLLGSAWLAHMNKPVAETLSANITAVGLPTWDDADQTLAKALQRELKQPDIGLPSKLQPLRAGIHPGPELRRRFGRHRRCLLERADGVVELPGQHPQSPGAPLGQRCGDGDADRAQGRHRRSEGAGHDGARLSPQAGPRGAGTCLLRGADQRPEVSTVHRA